MTRCSLCAWCSVLVISAWTHAGATMAASPTETLPHAVQMRLAANAAALSPIAITWKRERTSPRGEGLMPMIDWQTYLKEEFLSTVTYTFRWQDRMVYELRDGFLTNRFPRSPEDRVKLVPSGVERAFNRDKVYFGQTERHTRAAGRIPFLSIDSYSQPKTNTASQRVFINPSYLQEAGYWTPTVFSELGRDAQHMVLYWVSAGGRVVSVRHTTVDGSDCIEITIEHPEADGFGKPIQLVSTFLLDVAKGYAVRRRKDALKETGPAVRVVECRGLAKVKEPDLWLPHECQITHYSWSSVLPKTYREPVVYETMRRVGMDTTRMPESAFALMYTGAGTLIADSTIPEARDAKNGVAIYAVPAEVKDLNEVIAAAVGRMKPRYYALRAWLIGLNVIVLVGVGIVLVARRWGKV